jgi:YebC/PmpR family DNA-binding regulatory protein
MSGHSKWATTKHQKAITDSRRSKVFSRYAKLIEVAARGGADPGMNPSLRSAIDNAKAVSMPNDNIQRAVNKGSGADKSGAQLEEIIYEGYGPCKVAVIVKALTDNKNRAASDVRHIFSKAGGALGAMNSVSWMFQSKGTIVVNKENINFNDDLELELIDAGADDFVEGEESIIIYTEPGKLGAVKKLLTDKKISVQSADLEMIAKDKITVENEEDQQRVEKFLDALDDNDDVVTFYTNLA